MPAPPENPDDFNPFSEQPRDGRETGNEPPSAFPSADPPADEMRPLSTPPSDTIPPEDTEEIQPHHPPLHQRTAFGPPRHAYEQVSTQDDRAMAGEAGAGAGMGVNMDDEVMRTGPHTENDPLYPPPPDAYYRRSTPLRITHWGRLVVTLVAVAFACLAIAAVIDVSTPSIGLEPGTDIRSVADSVLAAMDRSADPCDNFYEYACGSWLRSSKIPPDRTSYSKSFSVVYDRVRLMLKDLLEGELQHTDNVTTAKAGTFYASCIEQHGVGPVNTLFLTPFRDDFNALTSSKKFTSLFARLLKVSSKGLYGVYVGLDDKNPSQYSVFLSQIGLGLPHRDNYLSDDEYDVEMRRLYTNLIQTMLTAAGKAHLIPRQDLATYAKDVLDFETKIANFSKPPEEMRDPDQLYNKRNISDMQPALHLSLLFDGMGVDPSTFNDSVIIDNPDYFQSVTDIMTSLDSDDAVRRVVRGYLAFHLAALGAGQGLLGENAYTESFKFQQYVYGIKQMPEKWKTCEGLTNTHLGDALGAAFVEKFFTPSQVNAAKTLSTQITAQFGRSLETLDWMDDETRAAAKEKLEAINWKVGYSSNLDTYDSVTVSRDSFTANVESCLQHSYERSIDRLGKPADKTQWYMNAQEVNAYYSPVENEMVFPAGILRPPFFSDAFPDAMNFGSIGAVIGHEMSHGFDASGRKYDKDGVLQSWWTEESEKLYNELSQCYVDLYNTFKPRSVDIYVNGNLTLNENLADTNGVSVSYQAFKSLKNNSEDGIAPPNALLGRELTNDQLFFVSYAQTWCTLYRPEALKIQMMTDPHSPGQFRVLGPLGQSEFFGKVFNCRNGTKYNPVDKCHLW